MLLSTKQLEKIRFELQDREVIYSMEYFVTALGVTYIVCRNEEDERFELILPTDFDGDVMLKILEHYS